MAKLILIAALIMISTASSAIAATEVAANQAPSKILICPNFSGLYTMPNFKTVKIQQQLCEAVTVNFNEFIPTTFKLGNSRFKLDKGNVMGHEMVMRFSIDKKSLVMDYRLHTNTDFGRYIFTKNSKGDLVGKVQHVNAKDNSVTNYQEKMVWEREDRNRALKSLN